MTLNSEKNQSAGSGYRWAFFDLDGTLVDSGEGITNSVAFALRHFGMTAPKEELYRFIGPPLVDSFMRFYGFSREQAGEAVDVYRIRYREVGVHENILYPGIRELLDELVSAGVRPVLATSKPEVFANIVLRDMEIADRFYFVAGAELDDAEGRKRKLRLNKDEVVAYALASCGARPDETVMIGDREYDIEGAKKNGVGSIGVLFGYGSREELENAGADYIAKTPADVARIILGNTEEDGL